MSSERRVKIKICGLREPGNLAAVCAGRPDFTGFIFARASKRYAGDLFDRAVFDLAACSKRVAVLVDEPLEDLIALLQRYPFEAVQLHGVEKPEYVAALRRRCGSVAIIKAFGVGEGFDFAATAPYRESCDYFLFDTASDRRGGSGVSFDWNLLRGYDNAKPFFLAGGLDERSMGEVPALLEKRFELFALDFNSRLEMAPGVKDPVRIGKIIREVEKWNIR